MKALLGFLPILFIAAGAPTDAPPRMGERARGPVPGWEEDAGLEGVPDEDQAALLRRRLEPVFRDEGQTEGPRGVSVTLESSVRSGALAALSWDRLDSRARLFVRAPGRFRFHAGGIRRREEGPFPDAGKISFAWDGFAPRWQAVAGDLDLRLGTGLLFSTGSPAMGPRDRRRQDAALASRLDGDVSLREAALRGIGVTWNDSIWTAGAFAAAMSLDATVQEGDALTPQPFFSSVDPRPGPHDTDRARSRKDAATEGVSGFFATLRRKGVQVDLAAIRSELSAALIPDSVSEDPDALHGRSMGGICLGLSAEEVGWRWGLSGAISIRPGPSNGMAGGPLEVSETSRVDPALQWSASGNHEGGRWSAGGQWLSSGYAVLHGAAPGTHRPASREWFAWLEGGKALPRGFEWSASMGVEGDTFAPLDSPSRFLASLWAECAYASTARFRTVLRVAAAYSNVAGDLVPKLDGRAEWRGSRAIFRLSGVARLDGTNALQGSLSAKGVWRPGKRFEARLSGWVLSGVQGMDLEVGDWFSPIGASDLTLRLSARAVVRPSQDWELGASYAVTGAPGGAVNHAAAISLVARAQW
ncbi:MAG: hypothetical protein J0L75_14485 [Spirochaetes bacterium]|nr:hypothetical protein [Spirochaetota bacterium]